jgi:hypothetical protein
MADGTTFICDAQDGAHTMLILDGATPGKRKKRVAARLEEAS